MRIPRLLSCVAGAALVGALVFGAASSAGAAPARPVQVAPSTTAPNSVKPFSEIAEAERKKHENNTRMLMMAGILFVLCSVAPFAVMKLIPFAEGIDALEGGAKFLSSRPMQGIQLTSSGLNIASSARGMGLIGKGGVGGAGGGLGGAMAISGKLKGAGGSSSGGSSSGGSSSGGSSSGGSPGFGGSSAAGGGGGGDMEFEGTMTPLGGSGGGPTGGPRHPVRNAIIGAMLPPVGAAMLAHKGVKAASRKYKTAPRGGSTP